MTTERRGLPEEASETGKSITPSSTMENSASTSTPSLAIHVHMQSQHPHEQETVNPSHDDSIASLRALSDSLSAFQRCFGELHQHIDSIRSTIHSVLPLLTTNTTLLPSSSPPATAPPAPEPGPEPEPSWESDPSEEEEEEEVQSPCGEEVESPDRLELESLCKSTNGRALRRYMVMRIPNMHRYRLREEVPKALKLSPNPARLVLDCMGKFYIQKSISYTKGLHMVRGRKASILVLECFLLMRTDDGVEMIEKEVKEEAEKAALTWRKRLITEGGVRKATEMDARGLLLLIGCFGIPGDFTNEDIRDLLHICYIKQIKDALRRSNVLLAKIPEIIEGMVKQNMEVDAVHIAYTFGIEDRFNPQRLLTSFLLDSKKSLKKMKENKGSLAAMDEVKWKHWFALKSVINCLKRHNIDPLKLLPGWKINEKIMALEKEIGGFDKQIGKKMAQKRKNDETESSRRFRNKEAKRSHIPPWVRQQRVDDHVDVNNTLLEGRTTGHLHGHTVSSSVLRGPAAGLIRENVAGSLAGTVGGVAAGGAGAGISANADGIHAGISANADGIHAGISAGTDVVQQGGSYAGGHGGTLVDSTPGQIGSHTDQLYGRRGDATVYDRLASSSYAYRPSSYLEGPKGLPNSQLSDAYRPPYLEGSVGLPNTTYSDAYKPPPYLEGSVGLPNTTHSDAYKPPPYLEGSMGLPNAMHSNAYRPPPYLEGSMGLPNAMHNNAYRPPPYLEASMGLPNAMHNNAYRPPPYLEVSMGLPNAMHSNAYRPPPYLEGSPQLPNAIPGDAAGQSSASDIYQVANTVTASELYTSSGLRAVDVGSSAASAYPTSYLYYPR